MVNHCSLLILYFSNSLSPLKLLRKLLRIYYPFTVWSHHAAVSTNKKKQNDTREGKIRFTCGIRENRQSSLEAETIPLKNILC